MTTAFNHFETAIIVHDGVHAYDTGVCTWQDDDGVTVEFPENLQVAYRYGDSREDDDLPPGLKFLGEKEAEKILGIKVTFED